MAESAQWIEGWEKERARGPMRYVVRTGVLGFGGVMFITNLMMRPPAVFTAFALLARATVWGTGGFMFGALLWLVNERRYRKHLSFQPPSSGKNDAA